MDMIRLRTPRRRGLRRGFTLIESATATIVIGLAVVAMCTLLAAGTNANVAGNELTTAVQLANNVHEMTISRVPHGTSPAVIGPRDELLALDGKTYSPAIDGCGVPVVDLPGWSQQVTLQTVDNKDGGAVGRDGGDEPLRLTVTVCHAGRRVYAQSWLIASP